MSKNTQLLAAAFVAAATVGLLYYLSTENAKATAKSKPKKDLDDPVDDKKSADVKKPSLSSSTTPSTKKGKRAAAADDTPKKSNVSDQKEMHSKIEELDKKGKALFKNKKVSLFAVLICYSIWDCTLRIALFGFIYFISQSPCIISWP
jgi:hypothetical protein